MITKWTGVGYARRYVREIIDNRATNLNKRLMIAGKRGWENECLVLRIGVRTFRIGRYFLSHLILTSQLHPDSGV